ncbi:DNA mismatch repair protein Mlh3 isoform X3 [Columba livia]|uniref:DNA mismatch repair protein Mlh3 isoform X3 n=1 Tax=Columba livia TaxID=8932 RepID=UPI0031BA1488
MIKRLVEDVRARLRSGVTISSVGQCVEELVLNSIDAKATCVAIRVDLEAFKIQVVDNGSGMGREDLNAMGKRYFTSKCSSVGDLENLTFYGFRGEAVASIANMATVVEVSSKTSRTAKTFVKLFHNGQALEVCEAELSRPSGGTTVTVCNLFYQLPVRKKRMDPVLELERVRHKVEAISLMHPSVSLSLRNDAAASMVLQLPKTRDIYSRFCQIYGLGRSQKLREINHKSGGFELSGYISIEGHYNKNMQFLYVNRRLVLKTRLHKLIDFLLRKESVICCKAKSGPVSRQAGASAGRYRCVPELYGIFILNVTCAYSDYDVCLEPAKTLIEFQNWDVLLTCIEEGVKVFLKREHLFVEPCGEDIREFNEENNFCLYNAPVLKPSLSDKKSTQDNFKKACDEIADSYEMCSLQSKDVKRKSMSGKKSLSLIESNKNLQETEMAPYQKIAEPSDLCRNNHVEIPLPSKDDTASDFIVSNISEQEPKDTNSSQKSSDTHLKPSENLCSSFSGGAISETRKIVSCGDLQHSAENYIKDMGSKQGKVVEKRNTVCILNNDVIRSPSEREDLTETAMGTETVSGSSLMRTGDRETAEVIDDAGRGAVSSVPLKSCSTSVIKHVTQNQPTHACEQTEMNLSLNTQCRPGPIRTQDTFGHKVSFLIQSLNAKDISSNTSEEYTPLLTREVCMADGSERSENKTFPNQVSEGITMPIATSKRHYKTLNVTGLPEATSSCVPHNKMIKSTRRQIALPRPQPPKKLSLCTQLGSLEKFRRYYGRVRCVLPTPLSEQSEFGLPVFNSQANCGFSKNGNDNHGSVSTSETPTLEDTDPSNSIQVFDALEETSLCSGETSQDKQALCLSPLTSSDYSQVSKKIIRCRKSPGSLSSKLSRLKSDHKEVTQLGEQFQTDSSRKDDYSFDLESSNNDFLYNACQTYKSLEEKMKECNYSISKEDVCSQPDGTRAESMKSTVSLSPLSSTEGEYTVSSGSVLPAQEDCTNITCEEKSTLGESSEQNLKDTEVPHMTFPSNLEFSADNTSAGNPRNDLWCSNWLQDFDVSLGKTIYINKTTGLSTYSTPPAEAFQAACIQDITTMAVNVVTQNDAEGESLQSLLSEWDNPVFVPCPEVAVDVTSSQADNLAVKIHNILYPYRFTKDMVHSMQVIFFLSILQVLQQVDNKFIACLINTRNEMDKKTDGNLLILVDQHAAHERIRLEQLIADSYDKEAAARGKKKLLSSAISPPLEIEVTEEQRRFLRCCYKNLEDLGLELSFPENSSSLILVRKVPLCSTERDANELQRKRQPVTKSVIEELIQEQVELVQTTGAGARGTLPLTFLKMFASQACHGAIKFNEHLTLEESCRLIKALSSCQLPFQCAHGRPSMMPLADIDHLQQEKQPKPNLARLRKMARAWHLFGKKRP